MATALLMGVKTNFAFDRSLRSVDADGHMRVEESRISKANVCPYKGSEIPCWQELGLDPDRIYRLFRDPGELEKGASTFDGKPLLVRHVPVSAELPRKELCVGSVGVCSFEEPYLVTRPLMVWTQEAKDLIDSGEQRELSAAYRYDAEMVPGVYGGEAYDGRMVNIQGNHVAIVSEGRAGPDVHVADEQIPEFRTMSSPRAQAILKAITPLLGTGADSEQILLAMDKSIWETEEKSVVELSADEKEEAEKKAKDAKRSAGKDEDLDEKEREEAYEKARDAKRKAHDKKAKDAKRHGKDESEKKDEEEEEAEDEKDHREDFNSIKQGKDSMSKDELRRELKAELTKQFSEAAQAREAVKPLVGVVSLAMDSAEGIYRFALERVGNQRAKSAHVDALPDMIAAAVNARLVKASAPLAMDESQASLVDLDAIFGPRAAV